MVLLVSLLGMAVCSPDSTASGGGPSVIPPGPEPIMIDDPSDQDLLALDVEAYAQKNMFHCKFDVTNK